MASFSIPDVRRIRSYFLRLPLATRLMLLVLTGFYIAVCVRPNLEQWGALIPQEIDLTSREHHPKTPQQPLPPANLTPSLPPEHLPTPP